MIRLYVYLAIAAAVLAGIGAIYAKGRLDARHVAEVNRLRAQIGVLVEEREREAAARRADAAQAKTDREEADQQDREARSLENALDDPGGVVFGARDADGLRSLFSRRYPPKPARNPG